MNHLLWSISSLSKLGFLRLQSVSHLENLVLSFLSQLAYTTSEQKQRGVSEESQPKHSENRQIVLELANRTKSQKDEE